MHIQVPTVLLDGTVLANFKQRRHVRLRINEDRPRKFICQ